MSLESGKVEISTDVLVVQSGLVVQNELDVLEELLTNSDDAVVRNNLTTKLDIIIRRSKNAFEISDNGPGLSKEKVKDRILKYGKIIEKDNIEELTRGRGQFNRGLKEVIMSCLDEKEGLAFVESKTSNEEAWAYEFKRKELELIYKEIQPFSDINTESYFHVKILPKSNFSRTSSDNYFKEQIECGIKFSPVLDRHNVKLIDKRGVEHYLKSRKNLICYAENGYHVDFSEALNLKKHDLIVPEEYKILEKIEVFLSIKEAFQFSGDPLRRLAPTTRKNPRIDSTGIVIRDNHNISGKTLLHFGYREELGYLEIIITVPMLRALAIIGQKAITIPLINPDRSGFRDDHPLFLAICESQVMKKINEAIQYINEKIQRKRRKSVNKALTRREALTRELINDYMDNVFGTPMLQEVEGSTYEIPDGTLQEEAEREAKKEETGLEEKKEEKKELKHTARPLLGVPWRRKREKLGCFRGDYISIKGNCLTTLVTNEGAVRALTEGKGILVPRSGRDVTYNYRNVDVNKVYSPANFRLHINEESVAGECVKLRMFIASHEISSIGREIAKIVEKNENETRTKMICTLLEAKGIEIDKEENYNYLNANSSISQLIPLEPVLWVDLPFIVLDPTDEEPEAEKRGYLRNINFIQEENIEDPITGAKRSVQDLHRAWQPTTLGVNVTSQNQWDLQIYLRSRFFEPYFEPSKTIDKQSEDTRILIANAISLGIAEIVANATKSEDKPEAEIIAKVTDELTPKLVDIFLIDPKSLL